MSTSAQLCPGGYDAVMTALYRGRTDLYDKCEIEPLLNIKDKIIQMCRLHDNVLEKLDIYVLLCFFCHECMEVNLFAFVLYRLLVSLLSLENQCIIKRVMLGSRQLV